MHSENHVIPAADSHKYLEQPMLITDEMLQASVAKAVELGLFPRKAIPEDIATNKELMLEILECALQSAEQIPPPSIADRHEMGVSP